MAAAQSSHPDLSIADADPARMRAVFDSQGATALAWRESTADERIARLKRLREAVLARRDALHDAFLRDYRKSPTEVEASELLPLMDELRHAIGRLRRWMRPRRVRPTSVTLGTFSCIEYQPRGRVLIVAPWNYPLSLSLGPLVSALAAGNPAIVKPSEMTPAVSSVLAAIVGEVFAAHEVALFEGGPGTAQALLDMPFDHVFFTGSPAVGRIVMAAAAKHLASVTLELGGKSPAIVTPSADLARAAQALMWGKFLNAGQTCIAPDHVFVHSLVKDRFVAECARVLERSYGPPARWKANADLTGLVNERHARRIAALLEDATARGAAVLCGGDVDVAARYAAPTLLGGAPRDARVMQEEIFGPLLPVIAFDDLDAVVAQVNARPKPLALYVFGADRGEIRSVVRRTSSGGACVNHCVVHFAHGGLPFGGVNESGIGNAHGFFGFRAFSHERAVLTATPLMLAKMLFPPFTPSRQRLVRRIVDLLRWPML